MSATTADRTSPKQSIGNLIVIAGLTAVLFAGSLALVEGLIPELGMDIDFKPFFVVYVVLLFVPVGLPTMAAAVGASLAEALLDVAEGAAADDPFGWVGYFVGFTAAGYIFDNQTSNVTRMVTGAIVGGLLQYGIEGLYLFALGSGEKSLKYVEFASGSPAVIYTVATIGNTVLHGIVLGALALIPTVRYLDGRVQRLFPHGADSPDPANAD